MKRIVLRKTSITDTNDMKSTGLPKRSGSVTIGMALAIVAAALAELLAVELGQFLGYAAE